MGTDVANKINEFKLFYLSVLLIVFVSCKTSSRIANAYSQRSMTYKTSMENNPSNQAGKQKIFYTAYLETAVNKPPQIEVAWINGESYQAAVFEISRKNTFAGISEKNKDSIILKIPEKITYTESNLSLLILPEKGNQVGENGQLVESLYSSLEVSIQMHHHYLHVQ